MIDKSTYLSKLDRPPTTHEMDGLFTQEDIDNKDKVWRQCRSCSKWTLTNLKKKHTQCSNCKSDNFDPTSTISMRTFNPLNKRKVK